MTSNVTSVEAGNGGTATATLVVTEPPTPIPSTPVPATPTPTTTPIPPVVIPVIPQVFQHVPQGIFNGTRNNTPTPVRPAAVAPVVVDPANMPVLRPPSTGEAGLADNGPSPLVAGLGAITALGLLSFAATRARASRGRNPYGLSTKTPRPK